MVDVVLEAPDFLDVVTDSWALFAATGTLIAWIAGTNVGAFVIDSLVEFGLRPLTDL